MEELTGFSTLISRVAVMELELAAMLDPFAESRSPFGPVSLIGYGVLHAFGLTGDLRIEAPKGDETDAVRTRVGAETFDKIIADELLALEQGALQGPCDEDVDELSRLGWDPAAHGRIAEKRATEERAQGIRLAGEPR